MNCELCGKKEDERAMQEQCGLSLCLSCDGKYTDEELEERTEQTKNAIMRQMINETLERGFFYV